MSPKRCKHDKAMLSQRDRQTEQVIAALKFLSAQCEREGLIECGEFVGDALTNCLKHYVAEKRSALDRELDKDCSDDCPPLN